MKYEYDHQKKDLEKINRILLKNNFLNKMFLTFGTFLGFYRQGNLNTSLSHNNWDDLDFSVKAEDLKYFINNVLPDFEKNGFKIKHVYITKYNMLGLITLTNENNTNNIDIQIEYPQGEKRYHFSWYEKEELIKGLCKDYLNNSQKYRFLDMDFFGPSNPNEYLEDLYGSGWETPCKDENEYKYWQDNPGIPWTDRYFHLNFINDKKIIQDIKNAFK